MEIRVEGAELLVGVEEIDVRIKVVFSTQFDVDMKEEVRMVGDRGGKKKKSLACVQRKLTFPKHIQCVEFHLQICERWAHL